MNAKLDMWFHARIAYVWMAFLMILANSPRLGGQTYLDATGIPSFATQVPVESGFINISNGNLHLEIPLPEPVQRGAVAVNPKLIYDSRIWQIQGSYSWQPRTSFDPAYSGGWSYSDGLSGGGYNYSDSTANYCHTIGNPPGPGTYRRYPVSYNVGPYHWADASNTQHTFYTVIVVPASPAPPANCIPENDPPLKLKSDASSLDGSGYHYYADYGGGDRILDKRGFQVGGVVQDTNGNVLDGSGDTSGRHPILKSTSGNQHYYDVLGYNGTRPRYTVTTGTINVSTNFKQSAVTEFSNPLTVVTSIQLPDGSSYQFQYDSGTTPGHYGDLIQITLPTGGIIHYGYSVYQDSYQNANHWLTSRSTSDGTWTYIPQVITQCAANGTGCKEKVTATSPAASGSNDTVYTLTLNGGAWNTQKDYWSGSSLSGGTKLVSTSSALAYNQNYSVYGQFVTQRVDVTTLSDVNQTQSTEYDYDAATGATLLAQKKFDYTACSNSKPKSETDYSYDVRAGFVSANILDHLHLMTSYDCGNQKQQLTYGYDEYGLQPTSNLPQHYATSGSRGNLTSAQSWLDTSNSSVTTATYHYDDAGQVVSSTDTSQQSTSYGHDSTDSYVTSVTPPTPSSGVVLTTLATYDFSTGLLTSTTDPNGTQTINANYDSLNRPLEVDTKDSSGTLIGKTSYSWWNSNSYGVYTNQSASSSSEQDFQLDGYGRSSRQLTLNGQGTNPYYQRDTCYDSSGRVSFQSYAYQGAGSSAPKVCSSFGDSYTYDALNRVKSITHSDNSSTQYSYTGRATKVTDENGVARISQSDGLGRLTGVCEISSSTLQNVSPTSCGLDIPATGFSTGYAYDLVHHTTTAMQGVQPRVFQTDSLGRTVSTAEPERGTTSYGYAYNGTGLLITRSRPKANQTNAAVLTNTSTQYDALGRVVSIGYDDGLTPTKLFGYDKSANWPETQTLLKGRMSYEGGGSFSLLCVDNLQLQRDGAAHADVGVPALWMRHDPGEGARSKLRLDREPHRGA